MVDALVVQVVPCLTGAHGSDSAENCGGAAVAARRFDISVVVQRQIPMVLFRTIEIPVATAAVVTSCSSSANCRSSAAPLCCGVVCAAMSCGGKYFSPDGAYDFAWDSVKPMKGTYTINFIQYPFVECVCKLNDWISCNDDVCADNYNFFRFKLQDKCCSEKWELYLYSDMTIKVDRDSVEVLPRGVPPPRFFTLLGNGSQTIFELCLPSVRGMGMSMPLAVPVSSGKFSGTFVSTAPAVEPAAMSFTVTLAGSTIDATAAVVSMCSASADCTGSATSCAVRVLASPCRVMVDVSLPMVLFIA